MFRASALASPHPGLAFRRRGIVAQRRLQREHPVDRLEPLAPIRVSSTVWSRAAENTLRIGSCAAFGSRWPLPLWAELERVNHVRVEYRDPDDAGVWPALGPAIVFGSTGFAAGAATSIAPSSSLLAAHCGEGSRAARCS